jgi:hypothetical protein
LCRVKEEKFEARLKELQKIINDDAKAWLFDAISRTTLVKSKIPLSSYYTF